jgi:glycosyltransferase involved in cell wall biosynthesis
MHICYITYEYPLWGTGGIGSFVQTIGRALVRKGHKVTVLGIGTKSQTELLNDQEVEICRLPAPRFFRKGSFAENTWRLRKQLKELHSQSPIDIVETPESLMFMLPLSSPYAKVIRMHGGHHFFAESENREVDKWKGFLEKRSFSRADAFVAVSHYVKNHTAKFLYTGGKPVEIIRYPIDAELFAQADLSKALPYRLVFAGTVCEKKGIRQLLEALGLLLPRFPELQLDVYGRDWFFPDGRSYTEFLKSSFPAELLKQVNFHGPVSLQQIPAKYELAELCVFPSHMETQGLVAPEAMLMGKPVLFSQLGPGPETIKHGVSGLLCDPHSAEDIAEKIKFAFENREEMQAIALRGQTEARLMFDMEQILEHNLNYYSSLLKKKRIN